MFFLVTAKPLYNFSGGVKSSLTNRGKLTLSACFMLFKKVPLMYVGVLAAAACACVCFSEQCLESMWVVERIHNAAL